MGRHRNEKTYRNWAEKPIEWVHVTAGVVQTLQVHKRIGSRFILGTDCTALRKAGKHTPGIAKFWDSKLGKAVQSLELSCCTLIDLEYRQAIPVHARQTPSVLPAGESRVDHYLGHVQDVLGTLPAYLRAQVECVVGDAYYSKRERPARCRLVSKKKTFVDGVNRAGLAFVGKLRVDANLKYKYTGPRTGKPGRPKQFDGKVERLKPVRCCCEGQELEGFLEMGFDLERRPKPDRCWFRVKKSGTNRVLERASRTSAEKEHSCGVHHLAG